MKRLMSVLAIAAGLVVAGQASAQCCGGSCGMGGCGMGMCGPMGCGMPSMMFGMPRYILPTAGPCGIPGCLCGCPSGACSCLAPQTSAGLTQTPGGATIRCQVPEGAAVYIDGVPTAATGKERVYLTPALPTGKVSTYEFRCWGMADGTECRIVRQVRVNPGEEVKVDFTLPPTPEQRSASTR